MDFALIASPLTPLLKNDGDQLCTKDCTRALEELKVQLSIASILITPDWSKEFYVYVDASNLAIGRVLSQKDDKKHDHPIIFSSRQLIAAKKIYSTTKREALEMSYSFQSSVITYWVILLHFILIMMY